MMDFLDRMRDSLTPIQTYDKMPEGIDLSIAPFPFIINTEGKMFVVMDSDNIKHLHDEKETIEDGVNLRMDATRSSIEDVRNSLYEIMNNTKLTKQNIIAILRRLSDNLSTISDELPYIE
jgi:predicted  nucleic acid-binding Zn-ribbon protein